MSDPIREALPLDLREYADALDKDRGHSKSLVTTLMREAATALEALAVLRAENVSLKEALREIKVLIARSGPWTQADCMKSIRSIIARVEAS